MAPKRKVKEVLENDKTNKTKDDTIDLTVKTIELKAKVDKAYKELLPNNIKQQSTLQ